MPRVSDLRAMMSTAQPKPKPQVGKHLQQYKNTSAVTARHGATGNENSDHESFDDAVSGDEATLQGSISDAVSDWSNTGRGPHVEFHSHEAVPLVQGTRVNIQPWQTRSSSVGRMLGRGSMGDVYETTIRGYNLAWKKITSKRQVNLGQRKEIDILKKVSHRHMVRLVGTYTSRMELGILLYPVALCDLHTFFEDIEAYWTNSADEEQSRRLSLLNLTTSDPTEKASPAYHQIGCLVSAIEYLHRKEIRHKDLKPSNILLSPSKLWLSDFGSATDFSLLSQSATDNERGTPRYFAPEV